MRVGGQTAPGGGLAETCLVAITHHLVKNWFEGERCKMLLWGEEDDSGCEIQVVDCFTAKVTSIPRAVFYNPCEKSNPVLQPCSALPLKHKKSSVPA